jgi:cytochrome c-type biogenesis protein CcmF
MMAYYPRPGSQTSEVAVKWGFWRDVYVAISQLDEQAQATLVVNIEPMVSWIWLGSCLLFLGILWAWWPERE